MNLERIAASLLALSQLALAVIAADAVLMYWLDAAFLSGFLKEFAYFGGLVGLADQLYWLTTERLPGILDM